MRRDFGEVCSKRPEDFSDAYKEARECFGGSHNSSLRGSGLKRGITGLLVFVEPGMAWSYQRESVWSLKMGCGAQRLNTS
jgi:hypothetical protein